MGWESRGQGRYYYHPIKVRGKVRKIYLGTGPEAEQEAAQAENQRQERAQRQVRRQAARAGVEPADEVATRIDHYSEILGQAVLVLAGYRQHERGEWRKRHASRS